jgi:hypothetical protein
MKGKRFQLAQKVREEVERNLALGELARLAETTEKLVLEYCEMGLLGEEVREVGPGIRFGEGSLFLVRRIEQLRIEYGVSPSGAGLVLDLAARVEELEYEIRSLREALGR